MKILFVTDIHYGDDSNSKLKGDAYINVFGSQAHENLRLLSEEMESVDLVVNLGDLIHEVEREKDILLYREAVSHFPSRAVHVVGNHDLRFMSRVDVQKILNVQNLYYSFDLGSFHHVVLDGSRREPRGPHYIPEDQLNWLETDLMASGLATIVYTHFPLDNQDFSQNYYFSDRPDTAAIANRFSVRRVLEKSSKVKAVFQGHTHFAHRSEIHSIAYFTIPSFSENDGEHKPNAQYAFVDIDQGGIHMELRKISQG